MRRIANHAKKRKGSVLFIIMIVVCGIVFLFAAYQIIQYFLGQQQTDDLYENISDTVLVPQPTSSGDESKEDASETQPEFTVDFEKLVETCPDGKAKKRIWGHLSGLSK